MEVVFGEVFDGGGAVFMAEEAFGGHDDEGFNDILFLLAAEEVEELGWGGGVTDLDIFFCAGLEVSF